jgi:hypothetical protein
MIDCADTNLHIDIFRDKGSTKPSQLHPKDDVITVVRGFHLFLGRLMIELKSSCSAMEYEL